MARRTVGWLVAALLAASWAGCLHARARPAPGTRPAARLAEAKARVMTADYQADLPGLARLREELAPLRTDPDLGHLAWYWSGFASWRIAINGSSKGMAQPELKANLEAALLDFQAAIGAREPFADAHAAAASVVGWLAAFHGGDGAAVREHLVRAVAFLARAKELEPDNPRVLWVEAAPYLFLPAERGGNPRRAIELYRRMLEVARPEDPGSPLPDWGRPEAHMSLAFAHLGEPVLDLDAAERETRAALRLRADWSYVRDVLAPRVERARSTTR